MMLMDVSAQSFSLLLLFFNIRLTRAANFRQLSINGFYVQVAINGLTVDGSTVEDRCSLLLGDEWAEFVPESNEEAKMAIDTLDRAGIDTMVWMNPYGIVNSGFWKRTYFWRNGEEVAADLWFGLDSEMALDAGVSQFVERNRQNCLVLMKYWMGVVSVMGKHMVRTDDCAMQHAYMCKGGPTPTTTSINHVTTTISTPSFDVTTEYTSKAEAMMSDSYVTSDDVTKRETTSTEVPISITYVRTPETTSSYDAITTETTSNPIVMTTETTKTSNGITPETTLDYVAVITTEATPNYATITSETSSHSDVPTTKITSITDVITTETTSNADVITTETTSNADVITTETTSNADVITTETTPNADVITTETTSDADVITTETTSNADVITTETTSNADVITTETTSNADVITTETTSNADITLQTTPNSDVITSQTTVNADFITSKTTSNSDVITTETTSNSDITTWDIPSNTETTNGYDQSSTTTTTIISPPPTTQPQILIKNPRPIIQHSTVPVRVCTCPCSNQTKLVNTTLAGNQEENIKATIQKTLSIDTATLSTHIRKQESAQDSRVTSQVAGILGILLVSIVLGGIVVMDVGNAVRFVFYKWTNKYKP